MVLVVNPIGVDQSRYYLSGLSPGRWVGGGAEDLGLSGQVGEPALRAVLAGHRPDGSQLLPRLAVNRRSGFDFIFAAPKSVSLIAEMSGGEVQQRMNLAHERAVDSTMGWLEANSLRARRGQEGRQVATTGFVAAAFRHRFSLANDPHLHSHVVVANVAHGSDGRWSSVDSRELYRDSRAAGAIYHASLRYHLAEVGLAFEWTVDPRGLGDIVGVPRAAIEATSVRAHQAAREVDDGLAGRAGRASAGARTRPDPDARPPPGAWRDQVGPAGLSTDRSGLTVWSAYQRSRSGAPRPRGPTNDELERNLVERHSRFRRSDVVATAARLYVQGASVAELDATSDRFLQTAIPTAGRSWTTRSLQAMEERILAVAGARALTPLAATADRSTGPPAPTTERALTESAALARLTGGGATVEVLQGGFLDQARVLGEARRSWEANGHRVAVVASTDRDHARWRVLSGLERPPPVGQPTVLVVDNADRRTTHDLHRIVTDAQGRRTKVVLVDGGTRPPRRRAESPAFEQLRQTGAVIELPEAHRRPTIGVEQPHGPPPPGLSVPAGRDGSVVISATGTDAMVHLVDEWHRAADRTPGLRMVALGPEEAEHLNALARGILTRAGTISGPQVELAGRSYQVGDRVAALKRDARLGPIPGGTVGLVVAVDVDQRQVTISWAGRDAPVTVAWGSTGRRERKLPLTHGYATTPSYVRGKAKGPVLALGDVESVAPRLVPERVFEVATPPPRPVLRDDRLAGLLAELRSVAPSDDRANGGRPSTVAPSDGRAAGSRPSPAAAKLPDDATRSLAELTAERDQLAASVHQGMPARSPLNGHSPTGATSSRQQWLLANEGLLQRWESVADAIAWREAALTRGAEVRPTNAVLSQIGPRSFEPAAKHQPAGRVPPDASRPEGRSTADGEVWKQAAKAIEAHRDRWAIADGPLDLDASLRHSRDLAHRADAIGVQAAAKQAQRARSVHLSLGPEP